MLILTMGVALLTFVLWLILMWRAYSGEKWELPLAGELAKKVSGGGGRLRSSSVSGRRCRRALRARDPVQALGEEIRDGVAVPSFPEQVEAEYKGRVGDGNGSHLARAARRDYARWRTYLCRITRGEPAPGVGEGWAELTVVRWLPLGEPESWEPALRTDPFLYPQLLRIAAALRPPDVAVPPAG